MGKVVHTVSPTQKDSATKGGMAQTGLCQVSRILNFSIHPFELKGRGVSGVIRLQGRLLPMTKLCVRLLLHKESNILSYKE